MAEHKVCALTKIILDDGVTIVDKYVECTEDHCFRYRSDDPQNKEAKKNPSILHNRVAYKYVWDEWPLKHKSHANKCFISKIAMWDYTHSLTK